MVFTADHRNFGGRDQIIGQIQNHHLHMQKIQSTMNTRIKPKKHVNYVKSVNSRKGDRRKTFSIHLQGKF